MGKIKILCTSTGCIEYGPERYRDLGIDIIRIHVIFEGKEYLEGLDLDPVKFFDRLETIEDPKKNLPTTAMPTTQALYDHFESAIKEGYDEAIVYTLSQKLGGTYNKICLIADEFKNRIKIHVIDTNISCFGEGLLAIKAQEKVNMGKSAEEIIKESEWMMRHQEFLGVDSRLDYLIYNGRLKGGKAFLGQMLKICPVIHFSKEGEIVAMESVRTPKKALGRMCEILKDIIGTRAPEDYILFHIYSGPSLLPLLKEIETKYEIATNHEAVIMSPVSGCHNGPWLAGYGLLFLRREDEPLED